MKKNMAYLFVTLTLLSLTLTFAPHASAQTNDTNDIKVLNYSYHIDLSSSMLVVMGEIQNIGSNTIQNVVLSGDVYSTDGADQGSNYGPPYASYMVPGEKLPFEIDCNSPKSSQDGTWWSVSISHIDFTVTNAQVVDTYPYADVKITSQSSSVDTTAANKGTFWVNGNLQNIGSETATNIYVIATFYNASGNTVWGGWSSKIDSLAPSSSTTFEVGAFDLNMSTVLPQQEVKGYTLVVQCGSPTSQGTPPDISAYTATGGTVQSSSSYQSSSSTTANPTTNPSATPLPSYQSSNDNSSNSVSGSKSSFDYNWIIYGVIIFVVIAAVAITIIRFPRHKPADTKTKHKTGR